jgi:hypothetical protein
MIPQDFPWHDLQGMINLNGGLLNPRRSFVKIKSVILIGIWLVSVLVITLPGRQGLASQAGHAVAAQTTPEGLTQPLPPSAETGANAPLVCGAVVLLLIIVGGVAWNMRLKKSKPAPEDY